MSSKITKATDDTLTEVATTLTDDFVAAVMAPLKVLESEPTEFYAPRVAGMAAVGYGIAGIFVGDKWGDSIPLLGGRRI
jgi:hypothetical protein